MINELTDEQCFSRVLKAVKLAQDVYNAFVSLGFKPENLISPANVFVSQKIDKERFNLPTIGDVPHEVLEYADASLHGNWTEAYNRGHFKHAFDYDIRSAYIYHAANLLDTRRGEWGIPKTTSPKRSMVSPNAKSISSLIIRRYW